MWLIYESAHKVYFSLSLYCQATKACMSLPIGVFITDDFKCLVSVYLPNIIFGYLLKPL